MCPPRPYKYHDRSRMYSSYYPNDEGSVKRARLPTKLCTHSRMYAFYFRNYVDTVGCARILTQMIRTQSDLPVISAK